MKIAILADIHANLEALQAVLAHAGRQGVEKYVCLGDIVGYNANPRECLEIVRGLDLLGVVMGNHDAVACGRQPLTGFNPFARQAAQWTREQLSDEDQTWLASLPFKQDVFLEKPPARFTIVHACLKHPESWEYVFDVQEAGISMQFQWMPICFIGHTHTPLAYERSLLDTIGGSFDTIALNPDHKYLVNCGSVGQPRDRDPRAAYVTYDLDKAAVQLHRVQYDVETAQRKITAAGLPEYCATRLGIGR
ncbi:MAG: metallophosphoesterase family protein [Victivallales bacterium]|nr:metallophosphoesterase family protein [Victivallales bacterium]